LCVGHLTPPGNGKAGATAGPLPLIVDKMTGRFQGLGRSLAPWWDSLAPAQIGQGIGMGISEQFCGKIIFGNTGSV